MDSLKKLIPRALIIGNKLSSSAQHINIILVLVSPMDSDIKVFLSYTVGMEKILFMSERIYLFSYFLPNLQSRIVAFGL